MTISHPLARRTAPSQITQVPQVWGSRGSSTTKADPLPGVSFELQSTRGVAARSERMFEYREGSTVDGSQFRSWSGGGWGNDGWNGGWEGSGYEAQPEMRAAIQHLREAQKNLESATHNKGVPTGSYRCTPIFSRDIRKGINGCCCQLRSLAHLGKSCGWCLEAR